MPRKMLFAALAGLVAMGVFIAVQADASATPKATAPPGLDHFLCYNATAVAGTKPVFTVPKGVTLLNQFSQAAFKPKFAAVDLHCNPALKIVPTAEFPPKSPSWHLLCFAITGKQKPNKHTVVVSNQFGSATLQTAAPNQFCLPSLKSTATPPVFNPPGAGEVMPDHFTCYPVKPVRGAYKPPPSVQVKDQFAQAPIKVSINPVPSELCVPTQKMIKGVVKARITNPPAHLLCYQVSKTPVVSPIWDQNQFGVGELGISSTSTLCLPSSKQLIK